jgi:lipid-binding SYLF domain-containing protein
MLETGKELSPVWSYVKSKGFYAGVEVNGTILISRTDEMARFYQWDGIKAEDVLSASSHLGFRAS